MESLQTLKILNSLTTKIRRKSLNCPTDFEADLKTFHSIACESKNYFL